MKSYIYYIIILFPLLISGCQKNTSISSVLEKADSLVFSNPDSAYHLLSSLQSPEKSSEQEYANWCLLMTQAMDKSERTHTSDSLINIAVRYYAEHNDREKLATALYTQGLVEKDLKNNDEAVKSFMEALDLLEGSDDYKLQYQAYAEIGNIYADSEIIDKAAYAYNKCMDFANLSKDSLSIAYANAYLGSIYRLQKEWKKSKEYYWQALDIAEKIREKHPLCLAANGLSMVYTNTNYSDSAYYYLNVLVIFSDVQRDMSDVNLRAGKLFCMTGAYDWAIVHLKTALKTTSNLYTKRSAYESLSLIYEKGQDYQDALKYNKLYWACNDSIQKVEKQKAIIEVEGKYNSEKLLSEKQQLEFKHSRQLFLGITFVMLVIIVSLLVYLNKKRTIIGLLNELNEIRYQISKNENVIKEYKQEITKLTSLQSEVDNLHHIKKDLEQKLDNLIKNNDLLNKQKSQILKTLNKKNKEIEHYEELIKQKDDNSDILARIKSDGNIGEKDWPELISYTNSLHNKFTERLRKSFPQLLEADIRLCCLIKLGLTRKEQIELLNITEDNLDKKKQRIRNRLDNSRKWEKGELEQQILLF